MATLFRPEHADFFFLLSLSFFLFIDNPSGLCGGGLTLLLPLTDGIERLQLHNGGQCIHTLPFSEGTFKA